MSEAPASKRYRAAWVVPISGPPIRDAIVTLNQDRISSVGPPPAAGDSSGSIEDLGAVAILPGLVNAHMHLELSYLRGAVPSAENFVTWIQGVMSARRLRPDAGSREILDGIDNGIREAVACGTAVVADISNTLVTYEPIARSGLAGWLFYELIKFNPEDASELVEQAQARLGTLRHEPDVRAGLAAHAPYSVAPSVFTAMRQADPGNPTARFSVHLSESNDEVEFIGTGQGRWRTLLEQVGSWDAGWNPPGTSPVAYLDSVGFLDSRTLAVHGVQMTAADLKTLAARDVTLVTCPRSNVYTGAGTPPIAQFYAAGVKVAVGTDSLASTPDLNLFAELAAMRTLAPAVPASALLESATLSGARALGFDADFGSIEPGKRARLVAVALPGALDDVEEYLVSGIHPGQIRWLPA